MDVDRRHAIAQCLMRERAAVGLIRQRVTTEELGSCGIPRVESAAHAFLAFDRTGSLDRLELALNAIWMSNNAADDDALCYASERASLAMALSQPDPARIVRALKLHAGNDVNRCLLVANKYATGASAPETLALDHPDGAESWLITGLISLAVRMGERDMVIDVARGGWGVATALCAQRPAEIGSVLCHQDFPRSERDVFLNLCLRHGFSRGHIAVAIECGAHLPTSCEAYNNIIFHSRVQSPESLAEVAGLITRFPNWREAWPRDGDSPLHLAIEAERAREASTRLKGRPRCGP